MKFIINISTQQEKRFLAENEKGKDYKGDGYEWVNPADKKREPQTVNLTVTDLNYEGSLHELAYLILDWLEERAGSEAKAWIERKVRKARKSLKKKGA